MGLSPGIPIWISLAKKKKSGPPNGSAKGTSLYCVEATNQWKSTDQQRMKKLDGFLRSMQTCIVLLQPVINFTEFEKGHEISNNPFICHSSNRRVEEDWADNLPKRHGTVHIHSMLFLSTKKGPTIPHTATPAHTVTQEWHNYISWIMCGLSPNGAQ